jgi:ribA/ribD-fused uncharacterized protein
MNRPEDAEPSDMDADNVVFFWKVDEAFGEFSQWYRSGFECDEHQFSTAEQYMMYRKAIIFNDIKSAEKILASPRARPAEYKRMGRKVSNFDLDTWTSCSRHVVVNGNFHKFVNNTKLMQMLLSTGSKVIAEASPLNNIWGVGFDARNAMVHVDDWGENRLGKCLMVVRDMIVDILSQISGDIRPKMEISTTTKAICYSCNSMVWIKQRKLDKSQHSTRIMITTCGSCMKKQGPAFGWLDTSTVESIVDRASGNTSARGDSEEIVNPDKLRIMHPYILTFLDMEKYAINRPQGIGQDSYDEKSWIPVTKAERTGFCNIILDT